MKIIKDTQEMTDPNEFGETLRNYCFIPDEYVYKFGGEQYGCYSTFKLRPEFESVTSTYIYKQLRKLSGIDETDYCNDFNCYSNGIIYLGWHWDGDGTLIIQEGNKIAINYDCKHDDSWEWYNE